jgi:hypothetical protein
VDDVFKRDFPRGRIQNAAHVQNADMQPSVPRQRVNQKLKILHNTPNYTFLFYYNIKGSFVQCFFSFVYDRKEKTCYNKQKNGGAK